MTSPFPLYIRHQNGAYSKLASPKRSLSFIDGKEIKIESETAEDVCEAYGLLCMNNAIEIPELEFNERFSKVIDRLLAAD